MSVFWAFHNILRRYRATKYIGLSPKRFEVKNLINLMLIKDWAFFEGDEDFFDTTIEAGKLICIWLITYYDDFISYKQTRKSLRRFTVLKKGKNRPKLKQLSKKKIQYALILVTIIVLVFIAKKYRSTRLAVNSTPTEVSSSSPIGIQDLPLESEPNNSLVDETKLVQQRRLYAAKRSLGLKFLELREANGTFKIPIRFTPQKLWCQGGDLDTMKYMSKEVGAERILITLEPSEGGKGDFLRTSVLELYNGGEHTFTLKPGDTKSFGLYICSDNKDGTNCKNKTLKSHAEMDAEFAKTRGSSPNEYIFYYQHVVLDNNVLEIYESNDRSSQFKKSIESYLTEKKGIGSRELTSAWKIAGVVQSSAADIHDGHLQLNLNYNDPKCVGGSQ